MVNTVCVGVPIPIVALSVGLFYDEYGTKNSDGERIA